MTNAKLHPKEVRDADWFYRAIAAKLAYQYASLGDTPEYRPDQLYHFVLERNRYKNSLWDEFQKALKRLEEDCVVWRKDYDNGKAIYTYLPADVRVEAREKLKRVRSRDQAAKDIVSVLGRYDVNCTFNKHTNGFQLDSWEAIEELAALLKSRLS